MAISISDSHLDELNKKFETWFMDKIKCVDQNIDVGIFINYILTTLSTEETSETEKTEAILPFLQELNQNQAFDEEKFLEEMMSTWNQMKIEFEKSSQSKDLSGNQENPTDTILNMINHHKTQLVKTKKSQTTDTVPLSDQFVYVESDEETETKSKMNLYVNKNTEDALNRDKEKREKLAEAAKRQKEQAKKALAEQRQKEEERKKKAQQKAAKVERKR